MWANKYVCYLICRKLCFSMYVIGETKKKREKQGREEKENPEPISYGKNKKKS
jgi:hypothetical protein